MVGQSIRSHWQPSWATSSRAGVPNTVAPLVPGEIAHLNVEGWLARRDSPEDPLHARGQRERVMKACNALSIAEACKLPRETVRCEVVHLIEDGYVYRNAQGHLYLAGNIGDRFGAMLEEVVEDLLVTAEKLQGCCGPWPPDRTLEAGPARAPLVVRCAASGQDRACVDTRGAQTVPLRHMAGQLVGGDGRERPAQVAMTGVVEHVGPAAGADAGHHVRHHGPQAGPGLDAPSAHARKA